MNGKIKYAVESAHGKGFDEDLGRALVSEMDEMTSRGIRPAEIHIAKSSFDELASSDTFSRHAAAGEVRPAMFNGAKVVITDE